MRLDISGEMDGGDGWVRVFCDAPGCSGAVEGRPPLGTWFDGWAEDLGRTPATTVAVKDYCAAHRARGSLTPQAPALGGDDWGTGYLSPRRVARPASSGPATTERLVTDL